MIRLRMPIEFMPVGCKAFLSRADIRGRLVQRHGHASPMRDFHSDPVLMARVSTDYFRAVPQVA